MILSFTLMTFISDIKGILLEEIRSQLLLGVKRLKWYYFGVAFYYFILSNRHTSISKLESL